VNTFALHRYPHNPILTGSRFPAGWGIKRVFNSGIVKAGRRYVMACRVEDAALRNRIWIAESEDGYQFTPRPGPVEMPHDNPEFAEYAAGMYSEASGSTHTTSVGDDVVPSVEGYGTGCFC
jgi:predicted GH43/DUF377 family glycosyl hydrolase